MHTINTSQQLTFDRSCTYATALIFIIGNVLLPQLLHLVKLGGPTWLPIYFFTLVGTALYGWRVGLLTALVSPAVNSVLFGMPAMAVLPAILVKSTLLAAMTAYAVRRFGRLTLPVIIGVVLGYQLVGTAVEWLMCGDAALALQDFRVGVPGMLLQIFAGLLIVRLVQRR